MNIYQYISPLSNHPPNMSECIICSPSQTYMFQNTYEEDYQDVRLNEEHQQRHPKKGDARYCGQNTWRTT